MSYIRFSVSLLLFAPSFAFSQSPDCIGLVCTEFADTDYYAREALNPEYPAYHVRVSATKTPYFVGAPTVNADDVTLLYGWDISYSDSNASGDEYQADYYVTKPETVTASQVVEIADSLIGTAYEGLTCTALLDAGFVAPCAIPPLEMSAADAPNPVTTQCTYGGQETYANNPVVSTGQTLSFCILDTVSRMRAAYPGFTDMRLGRTVCSGTTTKTMKIYMRWGTFQTAFQLGGQHRWTGSTPCFNIYIADPLTTHTQGTWDPSNPLGVPVVSDATDAEIFDALKPAISANYFINHTTGHITYLSASQTNYGAIPPAIIYNWGTAPSGTVSTPTPPASYTVAPVYVTRGPYTFPVDGEPTPTPTPNPSATPTPTPGTGGGFDCVANPNAVACADSSMFSDLLASDIAEAFTEEIYIPDGEAEALEVADALADALQGVGQSGSALTYNDSIFDGVSFVSGFLPEASTCQVFQYDMLPSLGMSIDIDTCELTFFRAISEYFLYGLTLFVLGRTLFGGKGDVS